jgi:phospholipid/cholesterol/gamma-HCH transport system substrate-binding protein
MNKYFVETLTGALVLLISIWCLYFFMSKTGQGVQLDKHYDVFANFQQADGVVVGTPVRIAGVKVGVVAGIKLDQSTYLAKTSISIDQGVNIPNDSSVKIVSTGLIGDKYLSIDPGASSDPLVDNDEIKYTQSSVNFESLIGKALLSK